MSKLNAAFSCAVGSALACTMFFTPSAFATPSAGGFHTIRAKLESLTEVQKEIYIKSLRGKSVVWTGWVGDVSESWGGGYKLRIDMDDPRGGGLTVADIRFPVGQAMALSLKKNQRVTFSGKINDVIEVFGHYEFDIRTPRIVKK